MLPYLQSMSYFSMIMIVLTGFTVLAFGDWRSFRLKYSAVVLSTVAGIWMLLTSTFLLDRPIVCAQGQAACTTIYMYALARNIALILFHISVGRDAIDFKNKDRRICNIGDGHERSRSKSSYQSGRHQRVSSNL